VPSLVLGLILRYLGEREATLWVETAYGCRVSVLGASAPTFEVEAPRRRPALGSPFS